MLITLGFLTPIVLLLMILNVVELLPRRALFVLVLWLFLGAGVLHLVFLSLPRMA